ncbi:hypothetical protein CERZMDRAFT_100004 [Cercospora zeae-maydis SCOH1-5]|uniref:RING-type domain-containing protein n=1 Tax=Cercospora zeae-maydis SCOH1-5 TaxID=717836 RepID=A0A6A6F980_9PEZI|nr:hypothetical protein CERZMDRAFT_100004 [Cercospora zeae-maydis SCOH1-5]
MASNQDKIKPGPSYLPTHADFMINLTRRGPAYGVRFQESCPICLCEEGTPFRTACGHIFCDACAERHFAEQKTCPMCRRELFDNATKPGVLMLRRKGQSLEKIERLYLQGIDCIVAKMLEFAMINPPGPLDFETHREAWLAGKLDLSALEKSTRPRTWVRVGDLLSRLALLTAVHLVRPRNDDSDPHGTCKSDWVLVGDLLICALQVHDGRMMPAHRFRRILKCYYRDERAETSRPMLAWGSSEENYPWPEYSNGLEKTHCFRQDLDCVLDFIVLAAITSYKVREFTRESANVAIEVGHESQVEGIPFWEIEDLGSLELEEVAG